MPPPQRLRPSNFFSVMAGLVPAIDVFISAIPQDVDARHKAGHDKLLSPVRSLWMNAMLP
jgi:hypothetical protein